MFLQKIDCLNRHAKLAVARICTHTDTVHSFNRAQICSNFSKSVNLQRNKLKAINKSRKTKIWASDIQTR